MTGLNEWRKVAIVAPHPDDEVLGCGGTLARLAAAGAETHVIVVTKGTSPRFSDEMVAAVREETRTAHETLGVTRTHYLNLPAAELDRVPVAELNARLGQALSDIAPDTLFVPFIGDIHVDHQLAFNAAMVWARPRGPGAPARILAYETLSETNWWAPGVTPAFNPSSFIDITEELDTKLRAFSQFRSQLKVFPDERSIEAIRALALVRGASIYRGAAEAFVQIRNVL